jgi:hypothetical protein
MSAPQTSFKACYSLLFGTLRVLLSLIAFCAGLQNEVILLSLVAAGDAPSAHLRDEGRLNVRACGIQHTLLPSLYFLLVS